MSKVSQTMKMVSGSTTYQVPFYTTTGEAGAYGTYGTAKVGSTTCYYGLGTGADAAHGSGVKTPLKVVKSGTTYYMLTKGNAELATYTLKLAATTNQTITLKYKNRNATDTGFETEVTKTSTSSEQSFTVRKGTTWTATVAGASGYNPGALSPGASGTVSANTTVSAGTASLITRTVTITCTDYSVGQYNGNSSYTVTYTNSSGTSTTSGQNPTSLTVKNGTTIKFNFNSNYGYDAYYVYSGNTWNGPYGDPGYVFFGAGIMISSSTWTSGSITANTSISIMTTNIGPNGCSCSSCSGGCDA